MKSFACLSVSRAIAGASVLLYLVLLTLATSCAFTHADQVQRHHHQEGQGSSMPNTLCMWGCQATSDVAAAAEPPAMISQLSTPSIPRIQDVCADVQGAHLLRSRAPPARFLA